MCTSGVVDAVVIATPHAFHFDNIRTALEAGLHVYCEKPLAVTVRQCRDIAALAGRAGLVVQTGFQHRFQHGYASAKRIVAKGDIGPLRRADLRATNWFRPDAVPCPPNPKCRVVPTFRRTTAKPRQPRLMKI